MMKTFVFGLGLLITLCGCNRQSADIWPGDTDMESNTTIIGIDDELPPMHANATMMMCGDTLVIHDHRSRDVQFLAYDVMQDKYVGSFGILGDGPNEIMNCGPFIYDNKGVMYVIDCNKWHIVGYDLNKALSDSTYQYFVKTRLNEENGRRPLSASYYGDDNNVLGTLHVCNENYTSQSTHIGKVSLTTGKEEVIDDIEYADNSRDDLVVMPEKDRMYAFGATHDRVRVFDMDGHLIQEIRGPRFEEYHEPGMNFFSSPVVVGDSIYVIYGGKDLAQGYGDTIMVFDADGNYKRSMKCDCNIFVIVPYPTTKRLYVSTYDTPQIGYIQL